MIHLVEKPLVYVETSVISYLTSRMSRDLVVAGHQQITNMESDRPTPVIVTPEALLE